MSNFMIECPNCGRYAEGKSGVFGFFATKKINCSCGYVINVKTEKMATRTCAHCGNMILFDQTKGAEAKCPVCHEHINTKDSLNRLISFSCPSCSCKLTADKNADKYTCPLCETEILVQAQIKKEELMNEGLASVIKYEGDNDTLIWKHPIEDFNLGSQLIVHESQEAIFFRDGQALDLFGAGRYTLETNQLPLLEKLYKLPSDANKTFHSEVYFINLAQQMAFKWGTSDKIRLIDPTSKAPIDIGARGLFNFRVANSRKLLLKLVGTTSSLTRTDIFGNGEGDSKSRAREYFRSIVRLGVSTKLAEIITQNNIDILQIDQQKMLLSNALKESLISYFDDYGMEITEFLVEGIMLPQKGDVGYDVVQTLIKLRQAELKKSVIATETDIRLSEMEAKKNIDIREQQISAEVEGSRRIAAYEKGQTEILKTQIEGQKHLTATEFDVQSKKLELELEMERKAKTASIEAEEMRAKGFNQRDVIQGQVMTSFAENQPKEGGGMNMSGVAGQALQMGAGFATMGAMAGMATNMMGTGANLGKEMTNQAVGAVKMPGSDSANQSVNPHAPGSFNMNNVNNNLSQMGEVSNLKTSAGDKTWNCANCGLTNITSKFCPDCGTKKPEEAPVENLTNNNTWNCAKCGLTGITSNFCPECGSKRE